MNKGTDVMIIQPLSPYDQGIKLSPLSLGRGYDSPSRISVFRNEMVRSQEDESHGKKRIKESIARFLTSRDVRLEYYVDEKTENIRVRIVHNPSGRIIIEIPVKLNLGSMVDERV